MALSLEFTNGLVFGAEHISGDEDDFFQWCVLFHIGFFRIMIIKPA